MKVKYLFIILLFSLQSCFVLNTTTKENRFCDIHNKEMSKKFVRTRYGRALPQKKKEEYKNAKSIHLMGCLKKRPVKYFAKIYSCKICTKLQRLDSRKKTP